jgi:cyclopropane-fatty-acyl-phospholipid synthase
MAEVRARGLEGRIRLVLGDYRTMEGQYEKVATIGMLEHLPIKPFFPVVRRLLKPGGLTLLHTVGINAPTNEPDPFVQRYVFPGSTPHPLSRIARGMEENGLMILDVHNIARHYHYTLIAWLRNFEANRSRLRLAYDDRFLRMWEYYLAGGAALALASNGALFQVLATNDRAANLPLHRV